MVQVAPIMCMSEDKVPHGFKLHAFEGKSLDILIERGTQAKLISELHQLKLNVKVVRTSLEGKLQDTESIKDQRVDLRGLERS